MVRSRERGAETAVLVFGLLTVTLWFGATLWSALRIYFWTERRKTRPAEVRPISIEIPPTYTARYGAQDRSIALLMALFFGALTAFFASHPYNIRGLLISTGFCCFSVGYAAHMIFSSVVFTRERITARILWRDRISEPYSKLRRASSKPGTLTLQFSDGRSLKLYSGLGDPDMVIAYLSKYAPRHVIPVVERR